MRMEEWRRYATEAMPTGGRNKLGVTHFLNPETGDQA